VTSARGHEEWAQRAPGLKSLGDALETGGACFPKPPSAAKTPTSSAPG
jgi:hypothetical protein